MIETITIIAVGLMGGNAIGTQAPIAGAMGQRVGATSSSLIVHVGATAAIAMLVVGQLLTGAYLMVR